MASLRRADVAPPAWAGPNGPLSARIQLGAGFSPVRLEAEPAWDDPSPLRRDARAWAAVHRLAALTNRALPGALSRVLAPIWPRSTELATHNGVRVGLGLPRGSVSVHIDRTEGTAGRRWHRVLSWLETCGGRGTVARIAPARARMEPVGVAVEGGAGRPLIAHVELQMRQACPLAALGIPEFDLPLFREYLRSLLGDCSVPRTMLTFRVSFDLSNGRMSGVSAELATAPLGWDGDAWVSWLDRAAEGLGLELGELRVPLESGELVPTRVGLVLDQAGDPRLHVCVAEG